MEDMKAAAAESLIKQTDEAKHEEALQKATAELNEKLNSAVQQVTETSNKYTTSQKELEVVNEKLNSVTQQSNSTNEKLNINTEQLNASNEKVNKLTENLNTEKEQCAKIEKEKEELALKLRQVEEGIVATKEEMTKNREVCWWWLYQL